MRTLLINPDTPRAYSIGGYVSFPLGLGYVAAVLEAHHEVKVIDVGAEKLSDAALRQSILKSSIIP